MKKEKNISWLMIVFIVYAFYPSIVACVLIIIKVWCKKKTQLWCFFFKQITSHEDILTNIFIYQQFIFRHTYSTTGENNELMNLEHHKKACRALKFSSDGIHLYTASKDKSIQVIDLNTGSVKQKLKGAHRYNCDVS